MSGVQGGFDHPGTQRQRARRRVPTMFFDYADRGSYAEQTLRANRTDLEKITLRQRVLIAMAIAAVVFGGWMMQIMADYMRGIFLRIPGLFS